MGKGEWYDIRLGKPNPIHNLKSEWFDWFLKQVDEFSVNVPTQDMAGAVAFCGSVSGRDSDKFAQAQLTPVRAEEISVPVIEQCPVNFQCKVIHKTDMINGAVPPDIKKTFYPSDDYHRIYFGQIMGSYVSEDLSLP